MEQRLEKKGKHSLPFRYFVVVMSISFVITSLLGVVLAFQMIRPKWLVGLSLALGFLLPACMLYLGMGK